MTKSVLCSQPLAACTAFDQQWLKLTLLLILVHTCAALTWSSSVPVAQGGTNVRKPHSYSYFVMGSNQPGSLLRTNEDSAHMTQSERKVNFQDAQPLTNQRSDDAPGAYSWGYRWMDEFGNQQFREETSDGRGTVRGRWSYREATGILRIVEYVADQYGYRTRIRSNEPGIVSSNPANAQIIRFEDENNIPE